MNDTVVYGSASTSLSIQPTPLISIIAGGFQRYVGRNMTVITVDGSLSYDPDFPESPEFLWVVLKGFNEKLYFLFCHFFSARLVMFGILKSISLNHSEFVWCSALLLMLLSFGFFMLLFTKEGWSGWIWVGNVSFGTSSPGLSRTKCRKMIVVTQLFYGSLDFVRDNPGEPVPEETFTHSHLSWSSIVPYLLLPSTTIHGILPVQSTCLTVLFHNLCPSFSWSTS